MMVWRSARGPLIVAPSKEPASVPLDEEEGYVKRCLSMVVPCLVKEQRIFQQDGTRSRATRRTMAHLARERVEVLADWPPYSSDPNVGKELTARAGARCPIAAQEEWEALPQELINAHCGHLPNQLAGL